MLKIDNLTVDDIGKILVLEKSGDRFNCPLPYHENSKSGALEINSDGSYRCGCGISGTGLVSLVSTLYDISYEEAKQWLKRRMEA